ncbi:hypothetical protein OQA88_7164 [Cercophora sp. LCS_1]
MAPIIFITGANTGIGYEAVAAFLPSPTPYHIILGSRSTEKGTAAIAQLKSAFPSTPSTLELVQIDLESDASIAAAYETISSKHGRIDALVNNAGGSWDHGLGPKLDLSLRESLVKNFDVNVAGTHVLTDTFVPLLLKSEGPRLLFVTSGLSSLENGARQFFPAMFNSQGIPKGWPKDGFVLPLGYRSSKAGLNMVMLGWHYALSGDGVKVWALSPGFLATGLGGNPEVLKKMGAGDPALGGGFIKKVVDGERDADAGKVITRDGVQAW